MSSPKKRPSLDSPPAVKRTVFPLLGAAVFLCVGSPAQAGNPLQRIEKQFNVSGRPVVVIHNVASGRIEVKSWKTAQVDIVATQSSNKIGFDMEQAGDRVDVTATIVDATEIG